MKRILALTAFCLALAAGVAHARTIDYPGSWLVMTMNDGETNGVHAYYSVTNRYSVGYMGDYWRDEEWTMNAGTFSWLAKRWNEHELQANLVFNAGAGVATSDFREFDSETEPAGFAGVSFDIEDRRLYASYENKYTSAGDIFEGFEQKARVGFAPYVAEYGSLHTWIMLQVDHRPWSDDEVSWTPMLRFFKGDVLVEVGYSDAEKVMFNVIFRF